MRGRRWIRPAVLGFATLMLIAGSAAAKPAKIEPRSGQYAGNGKKVAVFFDVDFGDASGATVRAQLPGCDRNYFIDASDEIDKRRTFALKGADSDYTIALRGRFTSSRLVRGAVTINTSQPECTSGTYSLDYVARRARGFN